MINDWCDIFDSTCGYMWMPRVNEPNFLRRGPPAISLPPLTQPLPLAKMGLALHETQRAAQGAPLRRSSRLRRLSPPQLAAVRCGQGHRGMGRCLYCSHKRSTIP
jgi:hypothetical protein